MCLNEILVWKYLAHGTNIVPFIGTSRDFVPETPDEPPPFCLVSPWMNNGILTEYLRTNPKANLLQLWFDVGKGLQHLHSLNIVHGDLRGVCFRFSSSLVCITEYIIGPRSYR